MSKITKKALESAFSELIVSRPLSKITVSDIAEKAGVNRHTFYYHYRSIDDLIVSSVSNVIDTFFLADDFYCEKVCQFIEYVYSQRQYILAIMHSESREKFIRVLKDRLYIYVSKREDGCLFGGMDKEFQDMFFVHGIAGVFVDWADSGMREPSDKIAMLISKIMKKGVEAKKEV